MREETSVLIASMILESRRLILRPMERGDEDDLFSYQSDPETVRFIPWPVRTREQVEEALDRAIAATSFENDGDFKLFVWVLKENGKVIGQSNISIEAKIHKRGEIGWVVNPEYAGKGYALEATQTLLDFAFTTWDFNRIVALMDVRNKSSISLAERLGMRREGEYKEDEFFKGEWADSYLYAILRREWKASGFSKVKV